MSDPMMRDQAPPNTELDLTALRAAGQFNVRRAGCLGGQARGDNLQSGDHA